LYLLLSVLEEELVEAAGVEPLAVLSPRKLLENKKRQKR